MPLAMTTRPSKAQGSGISLCRREERLHDGACRCVRRVPRLQGARDDGLRHRAGIKPIERLVPVGAGVAALTLPAYTPTADRDRTVSRRSEPSSRTTLNGEQPYPWDLLQPQDVMSRHRGAKRLRRYGLLGVISLLSPAYLLSVERWPSTHGTTGSLWPTFVSARPVGLAVRQACAIALNS